MVPLKAVLDLFFTHVLDVGFSGFLSPPSRPNVEAIPPDQPLSAVGLGVQARRTSCSGVCPTYRSWFPARFPLTTQAAAQKFLVSLEERK